MLIFPGSFLRRPAHTKNASGSHKPTPDTRHNNRRVEQGTIFLLSSHTFGRKPRTRVVFHMACTSSPCCSSSVSCTVSSSSCARFDIAVFVFFSRLRTRYQHLIAPVVQRIFNIKMHLIKKNDASSRKTVIFFSQCSWFFFWRVALVVRPRCGGEYLAPCRRSIYVVQ